jgi:inner membrane transporter RhtA
VNQTEARKPFGILLPILAIIAAMAAFQVGAAFAKNLFPAIGPEGAAALRLVFGAVMLLALVRPWRTWPARAPVLPLIGLGVAMAGAIQMFYLAIDHLPLGIAIAIQFLGPLAIAIAGSRRAVDVLWAILAAGGVWCLVAVNSVGEPIDLVGVAWSLGAAVCWAGYILLGRTVTTAFGNATAAISVSIAAIVILPLGVWRAGAALLSPDLIPLALLVALFSAAIPFSLEFFAMPRMPARTFAVFMSLEPTFGVMFGFLILHERLTVFQTAGVAMVVIAAAGAAWSSSGRKAGSAPAGPEDAPPT